ncbi:DUF2314 domain-containing protein [Ekhidna lutea]|nr:DUF2314 domain-containing protein [Ekhidna lutea]
MHRIQIFILILSFSCSTPNSKSWDEQNTRTLEFDNPKVERAMSITQENMPKFLRLYNMYSSDSTWTFYVKYGFENSETTEHMWVNLLQTEPSFLGILDNIPQVVTHVSYLDTIEFSSNAVEDFIVYHGDTLIMGDYLTVAHELLNN